jgi:Carbohydrate esterase, sialic acid-specific acetylesterase
MKKYYLFKFILFILISFKIHSQVTISYPDSRAIFQRNNSNQCPVYIAGNYASFADRVEARAVPRAMIPTQGTLVNWTTIQTNPTNGYFYGNLTVTGGWYDIEVRCWNGTTLLGTASVQRIGVGEVFVIAGQSNATGDNGLAAQGNYGPRANDDRVSVVNYNVPYPTNYGGIVLPRAEFSRLDSTFNISPFGTSAWCWGALGDTLTKRLNVPIAFFNAGWSGSGVDAWSISANDSTATPANFITYPRGLPYGNLRAALHFYVAQFGVRAVLWHQGETDNLNNTSRNDYGSYLKNIIQKSRIHSGKMNLAWVVSKASRYKLPPTLPNSRTWQPVIDAQNDVIGNNGNSQPNFTNLVFDGPATDPFVGPNIRMTDSVHFAGNGHRILASLWNQKLNTVFFTNSTPYLPIPPPTLSSDCNGISSIQFAVSNSYSSSLWTNNNAATNNLSTSFVYTASSGSYRVRVKDGLGNVLISPQINVPSNFSGLIPITSVTTGYWYDNSTWSCSRVPTSIDLVTINLGHEVIIAGGYTARFKKLNLNGILRFFSTGRLQNRPLSTDGN